MGKSAEEIDFIQVAKTERAKFVEAIQDTTWNTQLRTAAESLLIIYDQMLERLPVDGYREALAELVRLKILKDELDEVEEENQDQDFVKKYAGYVAAKKLAWNKAKQLLASPNQEQGEKQQK